MLQLKLLFLTVEFFAPFALASVVDYPPKGYFSSDATRVTWPHAVNSKSRLASSLGNHSVQMLEADVVIGTIAGSTGMLPIMAHAPQVVSDLSLLNFLKDVVDYNQDLNLTERKGIKLDFKDEKALYKGLTYLYKMNLENSNQLQFPIWINADVIPGPVNASNHVNVNGGNLIGLQKLMFPTATLSLGWTTSYQRGGSYTKDQFNEMVGLLKKTGSTSPITFPLRAQLALRVAEDIKELLDQSGIEDMWPSVTLWEGNGDPHVTQQELDEFIEKIGKDRVFVDLPYSFADGSRVMN